jgi:putative ABC transport system ATP-binding protein
MAPSRTRAAILERTICVHSVHFRTQGVRVTFNTSICACVSTLSFRSAQTETRRTTPIFDGMTDPRDSIALQTHRDSELIDARKLEFAYSKEHRVLHGADFDLRKGEFVAVVGPSGAGKSTLLRILSGHMAPDRGEIVFDGNTILLEKQRRAMRQRVSLVHQNGGLIEELNVYENALVAGRLAGISQSSIRTSLVSIMASLDIGDLVDRFPFSLSGGQRTRSAMACAAARCPSILFLDEPTGALDASATRGVLQALTSLRSALPDLGLVVATHDSVVSCAADRVVSIVDGMLGAL